MSSPADPFSILSRNGQAPGFKKPEPKNKVNRYRAGKAAQFENQEDDDDDDIYPISHYTVDSDQVSMAESSLTSKKEEEELNARLKRRRQIQRSVIVEENKDNEEDQSRNEAPVQETEAPKPQKKIEEDEDVEVEQVVRRRAQLKERLLEQEKVNEDDIHLQKIDENDEMDEEVEDENEGGIVSMLKPVFVSKHERETMNKQIEEEIALREEENRLKEKRKADTKMIFLEAVRQDDEAEKQEDNLSDGQMPADDDDVDEANQYEQWKIRELKRIKRDREDRSKQDKEKAEIERRRQLTDAQRAYENKVLGSDSTEKVEKVQYKFMQKYYHKGGFFQDSDDPIFKRDTNVAVGEDLFDKSGLPNIMRVRRDQFGKRGQTKYTHLTDQDTTNFDPQYRVNETIQSKTQSRLGGYKGQDTLDRPSARKR